MYAIRPYLLLIVIAIIVGVVAGAAPAIWTAVAGAACMILNRSASYIDPDHAKMLRRMHERYAQGASIDEAASGAASILISLLELGSIVLAIASSITLGVIYGWLPALGVILAFLGYAALRATEDDAKARRLARKTRETVN